MVKDPLTVVLEVVEEDGSLNSRVEQVTVALGDHCVPEMVGQAARWRQYLVLTTVIDSLWFVRTVEAPIDVGMVSLELLKDACSHASSTRRCVLETFVAPQAKPSHRQQSSSEPSVPGL